jgi:hypothetical protein
MFSNCRLQYGSMALLTVLPLWISAPGLAELGAKPEFEVQTFSVDLPLDTDGVPLRPLNNRELHRLLLAHSRHNEAVTQALANCHALGLPYGHPEWRRCIMDHAERHP